MIILASGSPRRAELLQQIGVSFEVRPADIDETPLDNELPQDYVTRLSVEKARAVQPHFPDRCILAADTSVVLGANILGKPAGEPEWRMMLQQLSGEEHQVITGFSLLKGDRLVTCSVSSQVRFRMLAPDMIEAYLRTGEGLDKAGGYGIQGMGAVLVERFEGSYSNVVGLPLAEVAEQLIEMDEPIWQL
jgi:septum formation protein